MDPNPDYDASDEIEYGMNWFAWILRGVYPPPAYHPSDPDTCHGHRGARPRLG